MVTSIPSSSVYDYSVKTYNLIITAIKSSNIRGGCDTGPRPAATAQTTTTTTTTTELKIESNLEDMKFDIRRNPDYFVEFIKSAVCGGEDRHHPGHVQR